MSGQGMVVEIECTKCHGKGYLPPRTRMDGNGHIGFKCIRPCQHCMGKGWLPVIASIEMTPPNADEGNP